MPATPDTRPPKASAGRVRAFNRFVNRYSIAGVFWLCAVLVLSASMIKIPDMTPLAWIDHVFYYIRQTMISGLALLLAVGLCEAWLADSRAGAGVAIVWRAVSVALAAALGSVCRVLAASGMDGVAHWHDNASFVLVNGVTWLIIGAMGSALIRRTVDNQRSREHLHLAACEREALETRRLEAQLIALQAQIEPHFLFNTLANVKRLYETEPGRGRDMLRSLIDYLRSALPGMRRSGSTVRRELEMTRSFLTILKLRMGERLEFDVRADDDVLDATMPPLMIATLVENAIKHGIAPLPEGGRIDVWARPAPDGRLLVEVSDDGCGFTATGGSGVGLANTRSRLAALFGDRAALELAAGAVRGVVARVVLPLRREAAT